MLKKFLFTSVQFIKGVGPIRARALEKYAFSTFWDMLSHLPSRYETYVSGPLATIVNQKAILPLVYEKQLCKKPLRFLFCTPDREAVEIIFFQKRQFVPSSAWEVRGLLQYAHGRYQLRHPVLHPLKQSPPPSQIIASYTLPTKLSLSSFQFSCLVASILAQWPAALIDFGASQQWPSWKESLHHLHFPKSYQDGEQESLWRRRWAYEELLAQQLSMKSMESLVEKKPCLFQHPGATPEEMTFLKNFGHDLTPSQAVAWHDIVQDLSQGQMQRFLHGDVGSGKTLLAFLAMVRAAAMGKQSCLMAPTGMLARQHFDHLSRWLPPHLSVCLRLGGQSKPTDPALITIGTHALLYEKVNFSSLSLVIIDEQHRFGVMQRLQLINKGSMPHLLFLSATPIPRTLEMILKNHMAISCLEKKHTSIQNYVLSKARLSELRPWIERCFTRGERVYWVCAVIDDEGAYARHCYWHTHFPNAVGLLHGRMSHEEKEKAMNAFRDGKTPLLISTTVIEVGMHVEEASTMIIEDSQCFGLAQLHQLRGRIGRGRIPGYCFFLYRPPLTLTERQRLHYIRACTDGFQIAQKDWQLRGAGKLLGTEQSGFFSYKFVNLDIHMDLIPCAVQAAHNVCLYADLLKDLFPYQPPTIVMAG